MQPRHDFVVQCRNESNHLKSNRYLHTRRAPSPVIKMGPHNSTPGTKKKQTSPKFIHGDVDVYLYIYIYYIYTSVNPCKINMRKVYING